MFHRRVEIFDDAVVGGAETGRLSADVWQLVAGGARYVDPASDTHTYAEHAVVVGSDDGSSTQEYWVDRLPILPGDVAPPLPPSSELDPRLLAMDVDEEVRVSVRLAGVPNFVMPLIPPPEFASAAERQAVVDQRATVVAERKAWFEQAAAPIHLSIESAGGTVIGGLPNQGSVIATMTAQAAREIHQREDVRVVQLDEQGGQSCDPTCSLAFSSDWKLGDGHHPDRLDIQRFHDAGYTGESPNTARHSWGDIIAAVVEDASSSTTGLINDEACQFADLSSCSMLRFRRKRLCSSGSCTMPSGNNFANNGSNSGLGTRVASILLGDLADGQARYKSFGDSCWSSGDLTNHCSVWREAATGMAPEAGMFYYQSVFPSDRAVTVADLEANFADVMNFSGFDTPMQCNISSSSDHEDAIEDAVDDGVLAVVAAGNSGSTGTSCNVNAPADLPKAFTVNGMLTSSATCMSDYTACPLDNDTNPSAARGGATATIGSTPTSNAVSLVDLVAPSWHRYRPEETGTSGTVNEGSAPNGSSMAAPHVSGAAVVVKDWLLNSSQSWVNSPGRLHAVMLAMGDRHVGSSRSYFGSDEQWGLGRLKLRLLKSGEGIGPYGYRISSFTLTSSTSDQNYMAWSTPFPVDTEMVKCVLHEKEDMSGKSNIGNSYLRMRVRQPVGGSCSLSGSTVRTRTDSSKDLKHMVAFEDAETNLEGNCLEVNVDVQTVVAPTDIHVFCYYAGVLDDSPN